MTSNWVRTLTSPFKKACTFFNQQQPSSGNDRKKSQLHHQQRQEHRTMDLHGEVMACTYEDVQVMWSILGKSKPNPCNITS